MPKPSGCDTRISVAAQPLLLLFTLPFIRTRYQLSALEIGIRFTIFQGAAKTGKGTSHGNEDA